MWSELATLIDEWVFIFVLQCWVDAANHSFLKCYVTKWVLANAGGRRPFAPPYLAPGTHICYVPPSGLGRVLYFYSFCCLSGKIL